MRLWPQARSASIELSEPPEDSLADVTDPGVSREAFRIFYDRTSRSLWAYLLRVSGRRDVADDLLQETFYRFLKASGQYESELHRRNAVYRIATNLACDVRRRRSATGSAVVVGDDVEHLPSTENPGRPDRRADPVFVPLLSASRRLFRPDPASLLLV